MNKRILLIATLMAIALATDRPISVASMPPPLATLAGKASNSDQDKDEADEKESRKNKGKEPTEKKDTEKPTASPSDQDEGGSRDKNGGETNGNGRNELGRVELSEKQIENAHLEVETAGPARIKAVLQLYGKIALNEDAVANVSPRFPGLVKSVSVRLGDRVEKGQVLAIVESNDSLRNYQVVSEIAGVIIKKEVTVGEVVRDDKPIFTIADLSTVWVDFSVFPQDFERVKLGQAVRIAYAANLRPINSSISYIAPVGTENTQSLLMRAVAQNSAGVLRPGLFVMGEVEINETEAPVAVLPAAVQSLNERTAIFVVEGTAFAAREVTLGARDDNHVQVLSGLNPGDRYVAANSFLLKAELGKAESGDQD